MNNQVVDEWLRVEIAKLIRRYENRERSERIKRGIQRRKERLGLVPKSS